MKNEILKDHNKEEDEEIIQYDVNNSFFEEIIKKPDDDNLDDYQINKSFYEEVIKKPPKNLDEYEINNSFFEEILRKNSPPSSGSSTNVIINYELTHVDFNELNNHDIINNNETNDVEKIHSKSSLDNQDIAKLKEKDMDKEKDKVIEINNEIESSKLKALNKSPQNTKLIKTNISEKTDWNNLKDNLSATPKLSNLSIIGGNSTVTNTNSGTTLVNKKLKESIRTNKDFDDLINKRDTDFIMNKMLSYYDKEVINPEEKLSFLKSPLIKDKTLLCTVIRNKEGVSLLYPTYYFMLSFNKKVLLKANRVPGIRSKYVISLCTDDDIEPSYSNCVGVLTSNFLGTEFNLFDKIKASVDKNERKKAKLLATIEYELNLFNCTKTRKMTIYIPNIDKNTDKFIEHMQENKDDNLGKIFRNNTSKTENVLYFKNQESLVLNFHGRVSLPSTKNFQIIEGGNLENPNSSNNIVLQFGKAKKDEFIIDFQYPFCPLQAFAFCLSALDKKLGLR